MSDQTLYNKPYLKEARSFLMLALGLYLLLCLASFHPDDPGWSYVGPKVEVHNLGGRLGAWLADLALQLVGVLAYLLPVGVLVLGGAMLRPLRFERPMWIWGLGAGMTLISSMVLLSHVHFSYPPLPSTSNYGGALGEFIGYRLAVFMGGTGSVLLAVATCVAGVSILLGKSWGQLIHHARALVRLPAMSAFKRKERQGASESAPDWVLPEKSGGVGGRKESAFSRGFDKVAKGVKTLLGRVSFRKKSKENAVAVAHAAPSPSSAKAGVPDAGAKPQDEVANGYEALMPEAREAEKERDVDASDQRESETGAERYEEASHGRPSTAYANDAAVDAPETSSARTGDLAIAEEQPVSEQSSAFSKGFSFFKGLKKESEPSAPAAVEPPPSPVPVPAVKPDSAQLGLYGEGHGRAMKNGHVLPSFNLLDSPDETSVHLEDPDRLLHRSKLLEQKLQDFGVEAKVVGVQPGPVITRFEIDPAPGIKVNKVANLAKDLARVLTVGSVRVVEIIPGKSAMGIEIPNVQRAMVRLQEILDSPTALEKNGSLVLALGKDIAGKPMVADLAKMPHLLVAGTTGSGKSVAVNAMILSLLFRAPPSDVRLIMVDPKMLELSVYEGIPHLLAPVVTDMKEAGNALRWSVAEMESRYKLMASVGVRNLAGYNKKVTEAKERGQPLYNETLEIEGVVKPELEPMPHIVVIIDELADLMMVVGKQVEELIARLAQKARAAGIHLILATQRPSVDVITGLIKANIPTRIAFQVSSKIDSRTILDQGGAEQLLGKGDMLYLPPGTGHPVRVHGAFVDDDEVHRVVEFLKQQGEPNYIEDILKGPVDAFREGGEEGGEVDPLYDQAVAVVTESRRASISYVQRQLRIGYNRSARMLEEMEASGVVGPLQSNGTREVLAPPPVQD